MVKLYANENFPVETVHILRKLGYDVVTTHEAVNSNLKIPDEDVLAFAITNERAIIPVNRKDFKRLHRLYPAHFGIIICTNTLPTRASEKKTIYSVIFAPTNKARSSIQCK